MPTPSLALLAGIWSGDAGLASQRPPCRLPPWEQGCGRQRYSRLETEARLRGLGVWSTPGGITRPWDFRRSHRSAAIPDGTIPDSTTPGGRRYRCREIGSYARAGQLLRQGHIALDGDGEACESLR